jgi:putative transposase
MKTKYKSNKHMVFSCKYHVIWCPKYRRKILTGAIAKRLKNIIEQIAFEYNIDIIEMETSGDHIHCLIDIDPQLGVMKFIKLAKGRSARILREEFPELKTKLPNLWTNSSFVSTVGGAPLGIVKQYIENQPKNETREAKEKYKLFQKKL